MFLHARNELREGRSRRAAARLAVYIGLLATVFVAVPSRDAHGQFEQEQFTIDLGVFGFDILASLLPSLYYRPFENISTRPSARAMGMGGAAIASETTPLAVGINPAGLGALQDLAVSVDAYYQSSTGNTTGYPEVLTIPQQGNLFVSAYDTKLKPALRYGAAALAAPLWSNGSQRVVGGVFWRRHDNTQYGEETIQDLLLEEGGGFPVIVSVDREESGVVEGYGPSLAMQIVPQLSVGANLNILDGRLRSSAANEVNTGGGGAIPPGITTFTQKYKGVSFNVGGRVAIGDRIAVGGTLSPGYKVEVTGGQLRSLSIAAPGAPAIEVLGRLAGYEIEVPSSIGVGVAIRPIDRLLLAADYNARDGADTKVTYLDDLGEAVQDPKLPFADISAVRFGAEFELLRGTWGSVPIRAGYRQVPVGFRDLNPEDYTYILNPLAPTVETIGVVFSGTPTGDFIEGDAFTFGASARLKNITYDLGFEVQSYELAKFYNDSPWDPLFNVNPDEGEPLPVDGDGDTFLPITHPRALAVDRTVTTMRFSATLVLPDFF